MSRRTYLTRFLKIICLIIVALNGFRKFKRLPAKEIDKRREIANRFVNSLVELGPTFVKLGQILSTYLVRYKLGFRIYYLVIVVMKFS